MIEWILEKDVFSDRDSRLIEAITAAGHSYKNWDSVSPAESSFLDDAKVVFHGSLETAHEINSAKKWSPGAFCNTPAFFCSGADLYATDRHAIVSAIDAIFEPQG